MYLFLLTNVLFHLKGGSWLLLLIYNKGVYIQIGLN